MKALVRKNNFNDSRYGGSLTTFRQHEQGNFFLIVTTFEVDQKENAKSIYEDSPSISFRSSEGTTFDSEPAPALSTSSNVKSVTEDYDLLDRLDIYTKPIPTNQFKVKAKIKSVQHTIPKIPPIEDYLL